MSLERIRIIKFANGAFANLRARLLSDLSREAFAVLLCKTEVIKGLHVIKVISARFPRQTDYVSHSLGHVTLTKNFIHHILEELCSRLDVDTIVDVHTHPFAQAFVNFSSIDDSDEIEFRKFLSDRFEGVRYGSIVLSQSDYAARMWEEPYKIGSTSIPATILTQTRPEFWPSAASRDPARNLQRGSRRTAAPKHQQLFDRTRRAIGVDILRQIMSDQKIVVVGAGRLGSLIAETLVQMGFQDLIVVDPDVVEWSNLSRLAGASYVDAQGSVPKVTVTKRRLSEINPNVRVKTLRVPVQHASVEPHIATANWVVLSTDSHSSRMLVQSLALKYFTPLLSVGVNITVDSNSITDMSGEIITIRAGDNCCLFCLGRVNAITAAAELHPSRAIRKQLVRKGYVRGADVKEPAVRTLNSIVSALACDQLINQFTERQEASSIIVYESNVSPVIFSDQDSLDRRNFNCYSCNVTEPVEPIDDEIQQSI